MDGMIVNAVVYDGTGGPPTEADVALKDGRIAAVGRDLPRTGQAVVDARGLALAPGFIDLHSHSDNAFIIEPKADSKIRQGVTTEVIGNCGMAAAQVGGEARREYVETMRARYGIDVTWSTFAEYFQRVEAAGLGVNCVALAAHGNIRSQVVGDADRPATPGEMATMKRMVADALADGAWGMSTGLIYVPSVFADTAEIAELAGVVAGAGGVYASHIRGEGDKLESAVAEAIEIGRRSGTVVEVSHHKASGVANWGKVNRTLAMMEAARAEGVAVYCDQYPYVASATGLDATLPLWALEGGTKATMARLQDPEVRPRLAEHVRRHPYGDWSRIMIGEVRQRQGPNAGLVGLTMQQVAERTGKAPEEALMDLLVEEACGVGAIYFSMSPEDVEAVLRSPHTAIGSDAGARSPGGPLGSGHPHPRTYGTFPRVLGHYVREKGVLSLTEAIHRMTGLAAARFKLAGRGEVRPGAWADLVLFDPDTVSDAATFIEPQQYPRGIPHVWVNGVAVVRDGEATGALPGQVLRLPRQT